MVNGNLAVPPDISERGQEAYNVIMQFLTDNDMTDTGGCKAFYSPAEWLERGEQYGLKSLLVVVHDGGCLAPICNMDYGNYVLHDSLQAKLHAAGFFLEGCTSWYSAVYER
jgi:hypothetical protein